MSNVTIAGGATNLPVASTIDGVNDYLPIYTAGALATQAINRNTLLGLVSGPVGLTDSQTIQNKVLNNTNTLTVKDGANLTLQNAADITKQARFSLASITTGNTRTLTIPDLSDTIVTLTATQTLTNKTLTSPTISAPTITNATLSADTITGFTVSNTGTVYGVAVTAGVITTAGSVGAGANATNGVQAAALAPNAITLGYAQITSPFTTTATPARTDVTGLSVTVTVPGGGRNVKITAFCGGLKTSGSAGNGVDWAIMEGSTCLNAISFAEPVTSYPVGVTTVAYVAAPSAGSHTYKVQAAQSGAGTLTVAAASNPSAGAAGPAFILVELI